VAVLVDVPPGVVTVTLTAPAAPAGAVAVTDVAEFTTTPVAAVAPNLTEVAPVRFVPVIVTDVPPAAGPLVGDSDVTAGTATYVKVAVLIDVPPAVVTVTFTGPAVPAGAVAVIWVAEFTTTFVAAFAPKRTDVAPVRFVPVIVTTVPPATGPLAGLSAVTVGTAT